MMMQQILLLKLIVKKIEFVGSLPFFRIMYKYAFI